MNIVPALILGSIAGIVAVAILKVSLWLVEVIAFGVFPA